MKPGEVHVFVAAPGSGKSRLTREVLADELRAGIRQQVLWATQSIRDVESLGHEALEHFRTLSLPDTLIVQSIDHPDLSGRRAYGQQFVWSTTPEVKIISHARIQQIFGPGSHPARNLASAGLLVIDEDPAGALLLDSLAEGQSRKVLTVAALAKTRSQVGLALEQVASVADGKAAPWNTFTQVTGYHLSGERFWRALHHYHPGPVDELALTKTLDGLGIQHASLVARTFAEAHREAASTPHRFSAQFGLDWANPSLASGARWRFNLKLPLTFDQPVLILDGYADEAYYRALFPDSRVVMHLFDPGNKLEIECAPKLHVSSLREGKALQLQARKQIAEELAYRCREADSATPARGTFLISDKQLRKPGSQWRKLMSQALYREGLTLDVRTGHWHAGRGSNSYVGSDVYALHPPHLNARYREYTLAALFPYDQLERARLKAYLEAAETLQMLNRGRQPQYAGPGPKPRVVLALDEVKTATLLKPFEKRVSLSAYTSHLMFTHSSNEPRWRDALRTLVCELLVFFPNGLPLSLLYALPISEHVQVKVDLSKPLKALRARLPLENNLAQALDNSPGWQYADVKRAGRHGNHKMYDQVMATFGMTSHRVKGQGQPCVYAVDLVTAEQAHEDFKEWLASGRTPGP